MQPKFMLPLAGLLLLACIGFYGASDGKTPAATDGWAGRLLLAEGRLHGGGRRCAGQGQADGPGPSVQLHVGAHRQGPGRRA